MSQEKDKVTAQTAPIIRRGDDKSTEKADQIRRQTGEVPPLAAVHGETDWPPQKAVDKI